MDVVKALKRLADSKKEQVEAWKQAQGVICQDYDDLTRQVDSLSFGVLDGKVADLRMTEGAEIPDEMRQLLLSAIKNTALLISETPLGKEAFKDSDIVYYAGGESPQTSLESAFASCKALLLVEGLDVTECAITSNMFHACSLLRRVDFSAPVNPTKAGSMFFQCSSLENINFPAGSLKSTTSVANMFRSCKSLKSVSFPEDSLSNVETADYMFNECSSLSSITLPGMTQITSVSSMFSNCGSLESINMDFSALRNLTYFNCFICNCIKLKAEVVERIIDNIDWGRVTNTRLIFYEIKSLTSFLHPETGSLTYAEQMFSYSSVKSVKIDFSHLVHAGRDSSHPRIFRYCASLTDVALVGGFASLIQAGEIFFGCSRLTTITGLTLPALALTAAEYGYNGDTYFSTVVRGLFHNCTSLTDCELGGTLYKSGVDLRPCAKLSARSLYTWVAALYDWEGNPEGKTTDDTDHTLYLTDAQQTTLMDYAGGDGESGEEAYLTALDRGWTISA